MDQVTFQKFADQANYGIALANLKGKLVYVNQAFASLFRSKREELIGRSIRSFYAPRKRTIALKIFAQLMTKGMLSDQLVWYRREDGEVFPARVSGSVIKDEAGKRKYITATLTEETERFELEEQQRLSIANMELISRMNAETAKSTDLDSVIKLACDDLKRIYSLRFADMVLFHEKADNSLEMEYRYTNLESKVIAAIEKLANVKIVGFRTPVYEGNPFWKIVERQIPQEFINQDDIIDIVRGFVHPDNKILNAFVPQVVSIAKLKYVYVVPMYSRGKPIGHLGINHWEPLDEHARRSINLIAEKIAEIVYRQQIQQEITEVNLRNSAIIKALPDLMFRMSRSGVYLDYVTPGNEMLIAPPEEIIGKNLRDLPIPKEQADQIIGAIEAALDQQEIQIYEYELDVVAGKRHFEARMVPAGDDEVLAFIRDISERIEAEEQLARSEHKFQAAFEYSPVLMAISEWNSEKVLAVNQKFLDVTGYRRSQVVGKKIMELGLVSQANFEKIAYLLDNENHVEDETLVMYRVDGAPFIGSYNGEIIDVSGKKSVLSAIADITKQKQAEETLKASQQRLSLHIEQTPLGVIEWDLDFKVTSWNESSERIFGYSYAEAIGQHASSLIVPEEVKPHVDGIWSELLKNQGGYRSSNPNVTKDGRRITCEWYNTPLISRGGEVIGVASLVQDITEQEEAKQQVTQDLQEKEILLKEIHHRVKNNLQVIISLLKLQTTTTENETLQEAFQDSINRIYSMALVHEQLYAAEDFSNIHFPEYIKTVLNQIQQAYGLEDNISIEHDLEEVTIGMDRAIPCGLILSEAVTNAVKHAFPDDRNGTIRVTLRSPGAEQYHLIVEDNGIGFSNVNEIQESHSLGMQLIRLLTDQIEGVISMENVNPGAKISVRF